MIVRDNEGRPLYTIWLVENEMFEKTEIRSSLPYELLWMVGRDILSLLPVRITCRAEKSVLKRLVRRLNDFSLTRFFYLPDLVIQDCEIKTFSMAEYKSLCNSLDGPYDHVYSDFFNPLSFEAMRFHFNRAQFLKLDEFEKEIAQISKIGFQRVIKNHQAASQYVQHLNLKDRNNLFYCVEEDGYTAYLMTTGLRLDLVLILEKDGEN